MNRHFRRMPMPHMRKSIEPTRMSHGDRADRFITGERQNMPTTRNTVAGIHSQCRRFTFPTRTVAIERSGKQQPQTVHDVCVIQSDRERYKTCSPFTVRV